MYRLLAAQGQVDERQNQRIHAVYTKPDILADRDTRERMVHEHCGS
jgi:hypothetical protein